MNSILTNIKKRIERSAQVRIYRHSLPHGMDLLSDLARRNYVADFKTVFDIGANVGQTALDFFEKFPCVDIYSFEPVPATFVFLQKNTKKLAKFKAFKLAFGAEAGELPMIIGDDSRTNTLLSGQSFDPKTQQIEIVEVATLDQFAKKHGIQSIDLLKIDTEGHDLNVLKGAERLLDEGRISFIQVETGFGESHAHVRLDEFNKHLQKRGYALFGIYEQLPFWTGEPWLMYANAVFIRKNLFRPA